MAQAKALLESIARSYGERFGRLKNVRVNTISQSPTMTTSRVKVKALAVLTSSSIMPIKCLHWVMLQLKTVLTTLSCSFQTLHEWSLCKTYSTMVDFSSSGITDALIEELKKINLSPKRGFFL